MMRCTSASSGRLATQQMQQCSASVVVAARSSLRRSLVVAAAKDAKKKAAAPVEQQQPAAAEQPVVEQQTQPAAVNEPAFTRTFRSLGSEVIESNQAFEEPPANDAWEGEKFEAFGQVLERWFLPGLVVLGVLCGSFAAGTYNNEADTFIKPAAGPDETVTVLPASAFTSGLSVNPAPQP